MRTFLFLPFKLAKQIPRRRAPDGDRFAQARVRQLLAEFTRPGDKVLDPFLGLGTIYQQVASIMKRNSHVVIEVSNLKGKEVTPLAWDIANCVSSILKFEGEIAVGWDGNVAYGYNHSYCLVFKKTIS